MKRFLWKAVKAVSVVITSLSIIGALVAVKWELERLKAERREYGTAD